MWVELWSAHPSGRFQNPFTEVGMITQVTAIQSVTDDGMRPRGETGELPYHLQELIDQTSGDLDANQRHRLAEVLMKFADIFPVPGEPLTWSHGCGGTRHQYG